MTKNSPDIETLTLKGPSHPDRYSDLQLWTRENVQALALAAEMVLERRANEMATLNLRPRLQSDADDVTGSTDQASGLRSERPPTA